MMTGTQGRRTPAPTGASVRHQRKRTVLIVIPAFNEAATIRDVIAECRACACHLREHQLDLEICVVDDGSTDATAAVVRAAGVERIIHHGRNRGLGAALRSGLEYGRAHGYDIVVKLDADGQHDPGDIPSLIAPIVNDEADIVYGDRFPRIGYSMPIVRRLGNAFFRSIMRRLTGWDIRDSQPGIIALGERYVKVCSIVGDYNYTQQILIDANHKGMRYGQTPVTFRQRSSGRSFISWKYPFAVAAQILLTLVLARPLRLFLPLSLAFLGTGAIVVGTELVLWANGTGAEPVEHVNLVLGLTILGTNMACFGVLAELVMRHRS